MKRTFSFLFIASLIAGCDSDGESVAGQGDAGCTPSAEICDGVDNDCDGTADNNIEPQVCDSDGLAGRQYCLNGAWGACQAQSRPPATEECNGLDDNGNGLVDESLSRACNTACGSGTEQCGTDGDAAAWIGCTAPEPETEICDGLDNDCDGQIDEGLERACMHPLCGSEGREICSLGAWVGCDAPGPQAEVCDGVDNDCDNEVDENLFEECGDPACGPGARPCVNGAFANGACTGRDAAAAEDCENNVDDDCNGQINDGCQACTPGTSTLCSADIGVCQQGTTICGPNGEWGPCQDNGQDVILIGAQAEICDGLDNDCDGAVDESFEGMGEPCGSEVGVCEVGVRACDNGVEVCQGAVGATEERCDGEDNDCDGSVDEDLSADIFESNERCAEAENIGEIAENNEPRVFGGTIYPAGDIDHYLVKAQETFSWCVPGFDQDSAYRVFVSLTNIPDGQDYDICLTVGEKADSVQEFCENSDDILLEETCYGDEEADADGSKTISYLVDPSCIFNDDTDMLIKVVARGDSEGACMPYTLTVWSISDDTVTDGGE
ncbi:hypothetical protein KKB55_14275 [Myxococcota bacterium]|nr:hypothetical protein [Myxococcota bacterium]